jgi:hypothetical protein
MNIPIPLPNDVVATMMTVPTDALAVKIALDDNTLRALCAIAVLQGSIASGRDFGTPHCVFLADSLMKDLKQLAK